MMKNYKIIVCLFFVSYLIVGLCIFKDYGISADELSSRRRGEDALNYIFKGDRTIFTNPTRYHGVIFEMLQQAIERILNLKDTRNIFLIRHLITFLLFYISAIFFYKLCKYRFKSWKMGLLGSLFLILNPRIFAHSFYNPKDIPFLAMFIISAYTLMRYLDEKTFKKAIMHAFVCAVLIDIRIIGFIMPIGTLIFFISDMLVFKPETSKKKFATPLVYIGALILFIILFWPVLWERPLYRFIEVAKLAANFRWNNSIFYFGRLIAANQMPWHYIPIWIMISNPIFYIFLFFIGLYMTLKKLDITPIMLYLEKRNDVIFLAFFSLPIMAIIFFKIIVYSAWRQLFFVYPFFLMLVLTGLKASFEFIKGRFTKPYYRIAGTAFFLAMAFDLAMTAKFMIKYHPHQNVYFNVLAGKNMEDVGNKFELDYWSLSYRQALEYILKNDSRDMIKVSVRSKYGARNAFILPSKDRKRLVYVENPQEADYFLTNSIFQRNQFPGKEKYYSIRIGGTEIMFVYKMN